MRNWLKEARKAKDFTQSQLTEMIEVDITTIGKYELGRRCPSPKTAQQLGEILGFEWTRFFDAPTAVKRAAKKKGSDVCKITNIL